MTIANYAEDKLLDTLRNQSFAVANVYVKLHTGDPGEACTNNAAGETTRKLVAFSAASGGSMAASGTLTWTNVSTSETYSWISLWDNVSAGNALWYGQLTSSATVSSGDTFEITSLTLTLD